MNRTTRDWIDKANELKIKGALDTQTVKALTDMFNSPDKENAQMGRQILQYKLKNALLVGLNEGQKLAFAHLVEFLLTNQSQYDAVLLTGYAGTGKTYLVRRVIEFLHLAKPSWRGAITAPTNKAVNVLTRNSPYFAKANMFETYGKPTDNIAFCTSHKLLGLKERITSEGKQKFVSEKSGSAIRSYDYIIGDETSMLDDDRYQDIMAHRKKIKIIFMGDALQIPPINKLDAKPFTPDPGYNLLRLDLTEIMRQTGDHPVVDLSVKVRDNIDKKIPIPVIQSKINSDGAGVLFIDGKKSRHRIRPIIKKYFTSPEYEKNPDFVRIIAYQNKSVNYLNRVVKECLFGKDHAIFEVGERLIANKALFQASHIKYRGGGGTHYVIKANTSDEFLVKNVALIPRTIKEQYGKGPKLSFTGKFWVLQAENMRDKEPVTLYVMHDDSVEEWEDLAKEVKKNAAALQNKDWWVSYYNILKWSDNVTYNYAITGHKSQGSEYDNVIFMEEDLRKNWKIRERNRIIYTCYTRAKHRLYIVR